MTAITVDRAVLEQALEALINSTAPKDWDAITALRAALAQQEQAVRDVLTTGTGVLLGGERIGPASMYKQQEPVAWSTRERFYEALDRAVENVRQEMRIKTVTMRSKDHDVALPIIDAYSGHVLVGSPPRREWQGLTTQDIALLDCIETRLREKNNG